LCRSKLGTCKGLTVGSREDFGLGFVDGINKGSLDGGLLGCMVCTVLGDDDRFKHLLCPNLVDWAICIAINTSINSRGQFSPHHFFSRANVMKSPASLLSKYIRYQHQLKHLLLSFNTWNCLNLP
jgi:hypothetical protein